MFKSVVLALSAAAMVATPIAAEARDRGSHDHRVERSYGDRHYDRGYRNHRNHSIDGRDVAIGLGALILGAAIGSASNNNRYYDDSRYYDREEVITERYVPRNCYTTTVTEYNYWGDRYQRRVRRCY